MKLIETLTDSPADTLPELTPEAPEMGGGSTPVSQDEMDQFKDFLRSDITALKIFIRLNDMYRKDGNLNSKDAKEATANLMSLFKGTESSRLGVAKWEPNQLAFAMFLDELGNQPIADFLGIDSVADLPNADLESRADDIRKKSIKKPEEPPTPQLSSTKRVIKNPLAEGLSGGYSRGGFMRLHRAATTAPGRKINPFA